MGFLCVGLCFNYFISLKYSGGNNSWFIFDIQLFAGIFLSLTGRKIHSGNNIFETCISPFSLALGRFLV